MNGSWENVLKQLEQRPCTWLVTGAAGFIGSHLVEKLVSSGQRVIAYDNLCTGKIKNIQAAAKGAPPESFQFIEADIMDLEKLLELCSNVDYVLHQAALGSVPRSIADPISTHTNNISGTLNVLEACRRTGVKRLVFASSSSVYGDSTESPKRELVLGRPLSPYALSKLNNEQYADLYSRTYGLEYVALRYFNVFGPRQDPQGQYAAVIPRWIGSMLRKEACVLYGDGTTTRDFCYVENVVRANILAATSANPSALNRAYNVACGSKITLLDLYGLIRESVSSLVSFPIPPRPNFEEFRDGDVKHSLADISLVQDNLDYRVSIQVPEGMELTVRYFVENPPELQLWP